MVHQTAFLVQVADPDEAAIALAGGADRLGLSGARGSLTRERIEAIVSTVARRCPVSASPRVLGESSGARDSMDAASFLAGAGVDALELDHEADLIARFAALRAQHPALGGIVTFRPGNTIAALGLYAESGFQGAFLKASGAGHARLIEEPGIEVLSAFVNAAQRRGLAAWIGGALEPPDVPRMLALAPNALAFRRSLCRDGDGRAPLDPVRIAMMRDLIPRDSNAASGQRTVLSVGPAADKVFVRDFVVQAGIGAYRYEHRAPQRMRFNVEADLVPVPDTVADMRDVFSYDVIVDAIRLATRRHVLLVERVALDVAEATLRDSRVKRVRVRVEKLDILDGSIGVEIERGREQERC